jgi:fructose-1-phosphate kinase PfkB-like protein
MTPMEIVQIGGLGSLAVAAMTAWWLERKDRKEMTKQLISLATAQIESNIANKILLESIKDVMSQVLTRL